MLADFGKKELAVGCSYVASSRTREIDHILFQEFPFDRISNLGNLPSMLLRQDEERRLYILEDKVLKKYSNVQVFQPDARDPSYDLSNDL